MGSPQMAFQWAGDALLEEIKAYTKFIELPGIRENFTEALEKFRIPVGLQRKWMAVMQLLSELDRAERAVADVLKLIVWKTADPNQYRLQIEFARAVPKKN